MIELPGIGETPMISDGRDYLCSSIDAIERVRLALGFESWNVLGYSTGSRIAEAYVQKYSAHVQRAVFLSPLFLDVFKAFSLRLGFWIDSFCPAVGDWILRGARLKFLILLFAFNLKPDPHTDEWSRQIGALPVGVLKQTLQALIPIGSKPLAAPMPFSIIWGNADIVPATPRKRGPRDYFIRANHAAPVVAAQEVAEAILSILK